MPGLAPYPRSKVIAERCAWDFMQREGGDTELVVVNPTFILGPTLSTHIVSSLRVIEAMLDGRLPVVPRQRFGVADVRDVADLHISAMAAPDAAGKRFLALADGPTTSFLGVAQILRAPRAAGQERAQRRGAWRGPARSDHPQRPGAPRAWMAPSSGGDNDRRNGREPARPRPIGETTLTSIDHGTVLITGPTGGLGRALALDLAGRANANRVVLGQRQGTCSSSPAERVNLVASF
jgi:nucleoside-diphosphate-sugar epimerase